MMLKIALVTLLALFIVNAAFAQKDTTVYYLTAAGKIVQTKEEADLLVKILPPEPGGNPKLFVIDGFYPDGKKLFHAYSLNPALPLSLQGKYTTFFQNGNKMSERNFDHGEIMGDQVLYYPNGKLYDILSKELTLTDTIIRFKECRDSTGNVLTTNGNGYWVIYNDDFSRIIEKGKVVNGLQDSVWTAVGRGNIAYTIMFKDGKKVPDAPDKIFTQVDQVPEFPGGLDAFGHFLGNHIVYPPAARDGNIQGRVIISFVVERDGMLTNFKIIRGIGSGCDEEALRVMKSSPAWKPGMKNGRPVRVMYSVPIIFSLTKDNF